MNAIQHITNPYPNGLFLQSIHPISVDEAFANLTNKKTPESALEIWLHKALQKVSEGRLLNDPLLSKYLVPLLGPANAKLFINQCQKLTGVHLDNEWSKIAKALNREHANIPMPLKFDPSLVSMDFIEFLESSPEFQPKPKTISWIQMPFAAVKKIGNFFYQNSIFQALNQKELDRLANENLKRTYRQKITYGCKEGFKTQFKLMLIKSFIINLILQSLNFHNKPPTIDATEMSFLLTATFVAPIFEEILHRGFLQDSFYGIQRILFNKSSQSLKNNYFFKWIISPSARILICNTLFAAIHLPNEYLSTQGVIRQFSGIMLYPVFSILRETSENISIPIAAHFATNALATLGFLLQPK